MNITKIEELVQDEITRLVTKIDESNLSRIFEEDLIIFETNKDEVVDSIDYSESFKLFRDVNKIELNSRKR